MLVLPFHEIKKVLFDILRQYKFPENKAELIATTHVQSSCDGVYSHGLNRFPLFIDYLKRGLIDVSANPENIASFGALERWDGNLGAGIWNAHHCMQRTIELARQYTVGCVALRNTNHWMRGGTYGWQAADQGKIGLCFTNTKPNMPPWGGKKSRIGNNPFVIAVPRSQGHVVLDMSLSQFSFGKMHTYKLKNQKLPFPGGWDTEGNLSDDPGKILIKERGLPIGYWKGSALSIVLDMLAALLSNGNPTCQIAKNEAESAISQVFISINPEKFGDPTLRDRLLDEIIDSIHNVPPMNTGDQTYYPGEKTLATRNNHRKNGIPVSKAIWDKILAC